MAAGHLDTATTTLSRAASAVTGANSGAAIDAFAAHWNLIGAGAAAGITTTMVARAATLGVNLGIRAVTIISRVAVGAGMGAVEGMAANTVVQLGSNAAFNDNHNPDEQRTSEIRR